MKNKIYNTSATLVEEFKERGFIVIIYQNSNPSTPGSHGPHIYIYTCTVTKGTIVIMKSVS